MPVSEGCLGGYIPICVECNAAESYEIDPEEYNNNQYFWDNEWTCICCRGVYKCELCIRAREKNYYRKIRLKGGRDGLVMD